MPKRTSVLTLYPRQGGLNTTLEDGQLPPGTLVQADNIIFDYSSDIRRRDGINYDWDSASSGGTTPIVGGIDYWVGTSDSKTQYKITVASDGKVYRTAGTTRTQITDGGLAWSGTLTEANCEVFNNRVIIAVSGVSNRMKYWDGDVTHPLRDLPANAYIGSTEVLSQTRASSGTTRTIEFTGDLVTAGYAVSDPIIITSSTAAYAGSFTIATISFGSGKTTVTYTASTSLTEGSTADLTITIGRPAPLALFVREHLGSLACNDKTSLDRLHYSGTFNHMAWGGFGGSGAVDIGQGDGDPVGLTGAAPTFKGDFFVGKRTKLYRLYGTDWDTINVAKVSDGIGFISHQAIAAVDQDDIVFASYRGFHALSATNAYGDFRSAYISKDIQRTFTTGLNEGRKRYIKVAYLAEYNSVLFAVSEANQTRNNAIYLYNIESKYWSRWPVEAESLITVEDADKRRVYLGTYTGRLAQTLTGDDNDTNDAGVATPIVQRTRLARLSMDGRLDTIKEFKRVGLIFRASGSYTVTASLKVDNFSEQAVSFASNSQALPLGTMVLGVDVLGGAFVVAPYMLPIDGQGRTASVSISQSDNNTALAIQGIVIEFESNNADSQEVRTGDNV